MPYIGNTIRAADDYRLIDDISSSFNGSTTSFALQVAGSAPVPFPKSPQQVLISVNGVIQEPDPTGASGFNLVGTNIVFSSAPTNGHAFFGIIYATADYLNAGGNFPAGALGSPSITFIGDENTGLYRKGSGSVGFVSDATEIANFDSNGITISSGSLIIPDSIIHNGDPNTKIRFSGADTVSVETAGTQRLEVASDGKVNFGSVARVEADGVFKAAHGDASTPAYNFLNDNDNGMFRATTNELGFSTAGTERLRIDNNGNVGIGTNNPGLLLDVVAASGDANFRVRTQGTDSGDDTVIRALVNNTTSSNYIQFGDTGDSNAGQIRYQHSNDSMQFTTNASEVMRIDSAGRLMIGTTAEGHSNADDLTVNNSANCGITIRSGSSNDGNIFFSDDTSGNGETRGVIKYKHADDALAFNSNGNERMRIDSSGKVGIGTTSPTHSLHVVGDGNNNLPLKYFRGGSGVSGYLYSDGGGSGIVGSDGILNNTGLYFVNDTSVDLRVNGSKRLLINSSGNIGIGTDAPVAALTIAKQGTILSGTGNNYAFSINPLSSGYVYLDNVTGGGNNTSMSLRTYNNGTYTQFIQSISGNATTFETAGSERMRIDSSGRVGIGTSSPTEQLSITNSAGTGSQLQFRDSGTGTNASDGFRVGYNGSGGQLWNFENNYVRIATSNVERLRVDSNGKVGIGITNPTSTLHISGDVRTTNRLGVGTAANFANIVSYVTGTGSYPPSGGLVQADNADSTAMLWNASNSANYTGLSIECRTTGAAYWMIANVYNSSFSGDLAFRTRTGGSSNGEKVRFRRDGGITFNGDTAAANALDDYEEGTYNATMTVTSGTLSVTNNLLSYTKIGDICHVTGRLYPQLSSTGSMGTFTFSLPFAAKGSNTGQVQFEQGFILHAFRATEDTDGTNGANRSQRNFRIVASESIARMIARNNGGYGTFGTTNPHMLATFTYRTA